MRAWIVLLVGGLHVARGSSRPTRTAIGLNPPGNHFEIDLLAGGIDTRRAA